MSAAAVSPVLISQHQASANEDSTYQHALVRDRVEKLAYSLWEQRGCPLDSPEADWLEAERQLLATGRS